MRSRVSSGKLGDCTVEMVKNLRTVTPSSAIAAISAFLYDFDCYAHTTLFLINWRQFSRNIYRTAIAWSKAECYRKGVVRSLYQLYLNYVVRVFEEQEKMGWLQGARIQKVEHLRKESTNVSAKSPQALEEKPEFTHVGDIDLPSDEINTLLEATFGLVKHSDEDHCGDETKEKGIRCSRLDRGTDNDPNLRFIPKEEIMSKRLPVGKNGLIDERCLDWLWIVVDNIVYDCSHFINDHPGGKQVILSFVGEDCSWQFWRFHSRSELEQYGQDLKIGRTMNVPNRYRERPKYIGLGSIGHDEW